MRYNSFFITLTFICAVLISPILSAEPAPAKAHVDDKSPASNIASTVTAITGIAISPLLGTGAYSLYQYYFQAKTPEQKAALPWYAKPTFFFSALLIVGVCALKDCFGAIVPPGLKKPADVLETIENKMSGLVAAGAIVPITMSSVTGWLSHSAAVSHDMAASGGLAMIQFASIDFSWALNILTIPFTLAVYVMVWMASHAITVLILLSPWGAVDAVLKAARTSVLGVLTITAQFDPKVSAILSLVVIVIAYFVAGWSYRLTIFGSIFCWEFFTGAKKRFTPKPDENWVFSGGKLKGAPIRTYGRLLISDKQNDRAVFAYRPWLFLAERRIDVSFSNPSVGKGLFFSTIREGDLTFFILSPRYRTHEEELVRIYDLKGGVCEAGLRKAWSALRELFSGSASTPQTA